MRPAVVVDLAEMSSAPDVAVIDPRAGKRGGFRVGRHVRPRCGPGYERVTEFGDADGPYRPRSGTRSEWRRSLDVYVEYGAMSAETRSVGLALAEASSDTGEGPGAGPAPSVSQVELGQMCQRADRTVRTHLTKLASLGLVKWRHRCDVNADGGVIPLPNSYRLVIPAGCRPKELRALVEALRDDPNRSITEFAAVIAGTAPDPRNVKPAKKDTARLDRGRSGRSAVSGGADERPRPEPYEPPAPLTDEEAAEQAALDRVARRVQRIDRDKLRTMLELAGATAVADRIGASGRVGHATARMAAVALRRVLGDDDGEPP